MRNTANIEIIGYVGQNPKSPDPMNHPNWVTFSVGVSRKIKNTPTDNVTWFRCTTSNEKLCEVIKQYIKKGCGVLIKGYPKAKYFTKTNGEVDSFIEISINDLNILIFSKDSEESGKNIVDAIDLDDEIPF